MKPNALKQCTLICKLQMEPKFSFSPHALQSKTEILAQIFGSASKQPSVNQSPGILTGSVRRTLLPPPRPALLSPGPADCGGERP